MNLKESSQVSFIAGESRWFRFSAYRIVGDEKRGMSIAPARGAQLVFYRPFGSYKKILVEFLRMAKFLEFESRDERGEDWWWDWADRIIQFYEEYGPLGVDWHGFVAPFIPDEEKYERVFSDPEPPSFNKSAPYAKEKTLRKYREPVSKILRATHALWSVAREWQRFRKGEFDLGKKWTSPSESKPSSNAPSWHERLESITHAPAGLGVTFDDSWRVDYSFDSLRSALRIMSVLSIPTEKIRLCAKPDCNEPFIVTKPKKKYHSDICGNAMRVRRHRQKKEGENNGSKSKTT